MQLIPRPTPPPTDIKEWLATFAGPFLGAIHMDKRDQLAAEIRDLLKLSLCDGQGR